MKLTTTPRRKMAITARHAQEVAKECTKAPAAIPATVEVHSMDKLDVCDKTELEASAQMWIVFVLALLVGLLVNH